MNGRIGRISALFRISFLKGDRAYDHSKNAPEKDRLVQTRLAAVPDAADPGGLVPAVLL